MFPPCTSGERASEQRSPPAPGFSGWLLAMLVALQGTALAAFALWRHATFNSGAFDLGIAIQVIWNSAHGRLFATTLGESPLHVGQHLALVWLLFVPVIWLGGDATALLVVQAVLLSLSVLPVAWYARRRLEGWLGLLVPLAYLLHPTLFATASFDLHEVAVAPLVLGLALAGLLVGARWPFLVGALLLLPVREDLGLVVAGLGLWAAVRWRWRLGVLVAALGLAWTALAVLVVIPAFNLEGRYAYFSRYGAAGDSPFGLLSSLLTSPLRLVDTVLAPRKLQFLAELLLSFGGLPLLAPGTAILALPNLGYLLLGQYRPLTELTSHYAVTVLPPLACAAVDGLARLRARWPAHTRWLAPLLLTVVVVFAAVRVVETAGRRLDNGLVGDAPHLAAARELLRLIPPTVPVSAQTGLVPHLATRERVYLFPRIDDAELVALDTRGQRYVPPGSLAYEAGLEEVLCDPAWGPVFEREGLLLLRKGSAPNRFPVAVPSYATRSGARFADGIVLAGYEVPRRLIRPAEVPRVVLYWLAEQPPSRNWTVFVHLVGQPGDVWGQMDAPPLCGEAPTSSWRPGQLLRDDVWPIPRRGIPPGEYRLLLGLYDPATGERLRSGSTDALDLGPVSVR